MKSSLPCFWYTIWKKNEQKPEWVYRGSIISKNMVSAFSIRVLNLKENILHGRVIRSLSIIDTNEAW